MNIEELISLIEDLQNAEGKHNEQLYTDWEIQAKNSNNENKKYENSREGELLQELDETKDTGRRIELIDEIRRERASNLNNLNNRLNAEIERLEGILNGIRNRDIRTEVLNSNDLDPNRIIDTRNPEEKREYENSREGELLQELDETRDVYRRREIIAEILNERESKLIKQRDAEIANIEDLLDSLKNRNFDKILEQFNKEKEEEKKQNDSKQQKVEEKNKTSNDNSNNKESKVEQTEQKNTSVNNKKWHSKLTPEQIEELIAEGIEPGDPEYYLSLRNYGIRDDEKQQKNKEPEKTEVSVDDKENPIIDGNNNEPKIDFDPKDSKNPPPPPPGAAGVSIPLEENDNSNTKKIDDDTPPPPGGAGTSIPVEEEKAKDSPENSGEYAEKVDTITINEDKIESSVGTKKIELLLSETTEVEQQMYDRLSSETKERIGKILNDDNAKIDVSILFGLLANEKQLNDYLRLCELYKGIDVDIAEANEARFEQFRETQELPEITYNLKGLRKFNLDLATKLDRYNSAKETKKMFEEIGLKDKVNIKIGLMDKMYLGVRSFFKGLSEGFKSKIALGPAKESKEISSSEVVSEFTLEDDNFLENHPELFTDEINSTQVSPDEISFFGDNPDTELEEIQGAFRKSISGHKIDHEKAKQNAAENQVQENVQEKEQV